MKPLTQPTKAYDRQLLAILTLDIHMKKFSAYQIIEQDGKSQGRFVDLTLDDLDPGEVVIEAHYSASITRMRSRPPARAR